MLGAEELQSRVSHGNWCLSSGFFLGNVCFIEQTAGGGEWLVSKENVPFASVTSGAAVVSVRWSNTSSRGR